MIGHLVARTISIKHAFLTQDFSSTETNNSRWIIFYVKSSVRKPFLNINLKCLLFINLEEKCTVFTKLGRQNTLRFQAYIFQ